MATGSHIAVTPGSGAFIATGPTYTEASTVVQDQKVILGLPYLATYSVTATSVSIATTSAHALQIMAGASLNVYVHRIKIQCGSANAVGSIRLSLGTLTSAGTGGTSVPPQKYDSSDPNPGATAMTLPSVPGSIGVSLGSFLVSLSSTNPVGVGSYAEWSAKDNIKPIKIAAGTANGIVIQTSGGLTCLADIWVELTEAAF